MKVTTPPGVAALRAYGFEKRYYCCPGQGCCARFPYWIDFKRKVTVIYLQGLWWFVHYAFEDWEQRLDLQTGIWKKDFTAFPGAKVIIWRLTSMEFFNKQSLI